jgi:DNA-directed RNA polymerase II subunit RPB1
MLQYYVATLMDNEI